ncbi:VanZ family protein [Streptomonospora alba]|uniref:VanZ family protein n=1 Tax=Streptomonospora alba TaxID=183763 RepID=UPI0014706DE1|nr:VanZ family protein [Streptomonospora alba]
MTIALVLGGLLVAGWLVAATMARRPRQAASWARVCLACAVALYFVVLVQPAHVGSAAAAGRATQVEWNPLAGYMQEFAPSDSFAIRAGKGRYVHFDDQEDLTVETAREIVLADESAGEYYAYRFEVRGEALWLDNEGNPIGEDATRFLKKDGVYYADPDDYLESESATLVVEELVVNFLLFVPIGIVAAAAFTSAVVRLLTGAILSLAIEASQLLMGTGGVVGTGDLIVNGTGGFLGAALVMAISAIIAQWRQRRIVREGT